MARSAVSEVEEPIHQRSIAPGLMISAGLLLYGVRLARSIRRRA